MNGDIMVDGEPFELEASGATDAHLRGIPLIAPRKRAVRVSALGKVPRHRRSSRVEVSVVRIRRKQDRTLRAMRSMCG
jgi:hypothetical protein